MSREFRYGAMIDAERSAEIPPATAERDWNRIQGSLRKGRSPLPVSALPLSFGAVLFTTKAAAMAIAIGATAASAGWFYRAELGLAAWHSPSSPAAPTAGVARPRRAGASAKPHDVSPQTTAPSSTPAAAESSSEDLAPRATRRPPASSPTLAVTDLPPSELELIGRAKQDIDRGSSATAQRWLREHARLYPHGVLQPEREALTVVATCGEGRGASAESAAQAFLRRYPRSIYRNRVERACHLRHEEPTTERDVARPNRTASSESALRPGEPARRTVDTPIQPGSAARETQSEASFPALEP